jgi:hypothetical protein
MGQNLSNKNSISRLMFKERNCLKNRTSSYGKGLSINSRPR